MYDGMKEKGKLKDILVRSCTCIAFLLLGLCWPNVRRMANNRMWKNFSISISTRLTTSCSRYSLLSAAITSQPQLLMKLKNTRCLSRARQRWKIEASQYAHINLPARSLAVLTDAWSRIGRVGRVAHDACFG